jgi:pyruvate dehydrogenase E2 component (dihydrolipoamide acetyltransferase)
MSDAPGEPAPECDDFGPVSHAPLSRIRQLGGARLQAAWSSIPHVTHFEEADVTDLDARRREMNAAGAQPRLTLLAWIAHACIAALRRHPRFCASLDEAGRRLVLKQYLNLGIAIDTPAGLVVGVLHDAGGMDVERLAAAIADLAARGRAGRLKPTELEGSCFTISSLGHLGGTGFTPIINPPEVAILGVTPARLRPAVVAGRIEPRLVLPLSLSYDHRVLDGVDAARFCATVRSGLESTD